MLLTHAHSDLTTAPDLRGSNTLLITVYASVHAEVCSVAFDFGHRERIFDDGNELPLMKSVVLDIRRTRRAVAGIVRAFLKDTPQRQLQVAGISFPSWACSLCQCNSALMSDEDISDILPSLLNIPALATVPLYVEINSNRSWLQRSVNSTDA